MSQAIRRAGLKAGVGLFCVVGLVGLRILTAPADGIEAEIAELDGLDLDAGLAAPAGGVAGSDLGDRRIADRRSTREEPRSASGAISRAELPPPDEEASDSLLSRLGLGSEEGRSGSRGGGERAGDRLVECELDGRARFMRADECAQRGGRAVDVDRSRRDGR